MYQIAFSQKYAKHLTALLAHVAAVLVALHAANVLASPDEVQSTGVVAQSEAPVLGSPIARTIYATLSEKDTVSFDTVSLSTANFKAIYAAMEYQPLWVDDSGLTSRAEEAIKVISSAERHGLNSGRYGLASIETLSRSVSLRGEPDARILAAIDLLISNAILNYMEDTRGGVITPQRKERIHLNRKTADSVELLAKAATAPNLEDMMKTQEPDSPEYKALRETLATYRGIAERGGWESWKIGKVVRPNQSDSRIPALRRILSVMGDYTGEASDDTKYDTALEDAVKHFQFRHGLNPEGVIGTTTQKYLAVPVDMRVRQIIVNLERMRWMPSDLGSKHVLVNVPGFTLYGFENGKQTLTMRVITGAPRTPTPIFSNVITNVIFNPGWSAPQSIVRKELLPKLRNNPGYFVNAGFTVYHNGEAVDPHSIDPDAGGSFAFRQRPGAGSALGKIKFNLPDNDDIYMHSTPKPQLFAGEMRALSHGCIRLENPKAMAHFVLKDEAEWDEQKIDRSYDSSAQRSVEVSAIPVHLVYWTAWTDANGTAYFYDDVYNKDGNVESALLPATDKAVRVAEAK